MHNFDYSVSLRIRTKTIDPFFIAEQLELTPKWINKIGEPRTTPKGLPLGGTYEISYCSFPLPRQDDEELHELLNRVVDSLTKHVALFNEICSSGGNVEFFIGWNSTGNTGDTFRHNLLKKLGELQIDLALDVYGETPTVESVENEQSE